MFEDHCFIRTYVCAPCVKKWKNNKAERIKPDLIYVSLDKAFNGVGGSSYLSALTGMIRLDDLNKHKRVLCFFNASKPTNAL